MDKIKFKLLLSNDTLLNAKYARLENDYLQKTLGTKLYLPKNTLQPFIFSCFALSVDGKLCFPDLKSGFAIAKNNHRALHLERSADWWTLNLARAISDAVIIGSNSLIFENGDYAATITIPELQLVRQQLFKPSQLLHIVIARDIDKINFAGEAICQDNDIPVIIFCQNQPNSIIKNFQISTLNQLKLDHNKQIIVCENGIDINEVVKRLHELGIKSILNESPYYHHELQQQQLLNEAWLNTSTIYIGGSISSLGQMNNSFKSTMHPEYTILTMHNIAYNFLYTRYAITYP